MTNPVQLPVGTPGYKSTEWYLTVLVTLAGLLLASGAFDMPNAPPWCAVVVRALGALVAFGKAMGYTAARTWFKTEIQGQIIDANVEVLKAAEQGAETGK